MSSGFSARSPKPRLTSWPGSPAGPADMLLRRIRQPPARARVDALCQRSNQHRMTERRGF